MEERKVLDSYSESEIEEAFLAVFDEKAKYNYITSYDIDVDRDYDDDQRMKIVVQIGSMAGAPTRDEFSGVKDMDRFEITFTTGAKATVAVCEVLNINTMEYHVLYAEVSADDESDETDIVAVPEEMSLSGSSELEDVVAETEAEVPEDEDGD